VPYLFNSLWGTSVIFDHLRYRSNKYKSELIFWDTFQIHLSESWSFQVQVNYTSEVLYMMNSHWDILELYLKWSILTEVYLISNLNYQLSQRCIWLVILRYISDTSQWELIISGTGQIHLSERWSFKLKVKYISEWVDLLKYKSGTPQWELTI
jgi:hypothetical protein